MAVPKIPVTIVYRNPEAQPPVFVAGGFSDPAWQPQEMEYSGEDQDNHTFKAEVLAEAGSSFQYKFRLGTGEWWVLDNEAPTVTDEAGNKNNVMKVPPLAEPSAPPAVAEKARRISNQEQMTPIENTAAAATTEPETPASSVKPPKPVRNAAAEIMSRSARGSGASTPSYARTAAEVADSAAIIDKEDSEPEIADEQAGKIGFRRLSSTPIVEVSNTAAEVADSAEALDGESTMHGLELRPAEYDDLEPLGSEDPGVNQNGTPLFAHECIGMYESDNDAPTHDLQGIEEHRRRRDLDAHGFDLNDPTLERFPSNWEAIVETVRKLEGGLDEDHATIEGAPLSPVISPSRRLSCDPAGDLAVSPTMVSPIASRRSRHLEVPRSPQGSVGSDRSSALSLQSIPEAEEAGAARGNESSYSISQRGAAAKTSTSEGTRSSPSDDSDGVLMKTPSLKTPKETRQVELRSPIPGTVAPPGGHASETPTENTGETPSAISQSGQELAQTTGSDRLPTPKDATPETEVLRNPQREVDITDTSKSTAVDTSSSTEQQPRNRTAALQRAGTPNSIHSGRIHIGADGNWLRFIFRTLFVDWIGGFIRRIWGGRQDT